MIETHVFNSLLKPFLKEEGWFHLLNFFNGLVAPSFLFVSGWAFVVASTRKLEDLLHFRPAFWQQLKRISLIWILGYTLHLPGFAFSALRRADNAAAWQNLLQVDILHCIAAGLSVLFALRMLVKSEDRFGRVLWLAVLVVVLVTPWIWASEWLERLPPAVSGYWAERGNTLFPQFPWLGFLMLGGACATTYSHADKAGKTLGFMRRTAIVGMVLIAVGYAFARYGFPWFYGTNSVRAHPVFFALRSGYLFLWIWICWQLQDHPAIPSSGIMTLSRESLLVYVAHIVFL
ncbi:MAG: heparan-alpha-glucosaminide N-acetyltransferase domain-containing protein, partial [Terriglobia bacterium]